jgi:hypothetical protein
MNIYIQNRLDELKNTFNTYSKTQKINMIRSYTGNIVTDLLWVKSKREYCEILANMLIENWEIKIWVNTYENLIDEIELFFESKKYIAFPQWQRNMIAYFLRKKRQSYSNTPSHNI